MARSWIELLYGYTPLGAKRFSWRDGVREKHIEVCITIASRKDAPPTAYAVAMALHQNTEHSVDLTASVAYPPTDVSHEAPAGEGSYLYTVVLN